jgi:serine/threonine-protein kinase RsbW
MAETPFYELTVPARFENLALIGEFIVSCARRAGFDDKGIFNTQLACDEACTNVMEHAYGEGEGLVHVACTLRSNGIEIQIRDSGKPFDPNSVPLPDLDAPLEEREVGGLGLHFMRSVMDDVRFEFDESGNRLTMFKRLGVSTPEVPETSEA